jgi:O-antigen biosynthesis protein
MQRARTNIPFEVIVVDDCSPDFHPDLKGYFSGVTFIRNRKNLGFGGACNAGAKLARGEYVYFLNSDVLVTNFWLDRLVEVFEKFDRVGAVGSKLVYPTGKLQEAGCMFWRGGNAWNYGRGQDPDALEFNYVREVDYCSAASLMVRADTWRDLKGFDPMYERAYAEDSDLCFRIRRWHGLRVMYAPQSEVIHLEGGTNGTDLSAGFKQYQVDNLSKFNERWKTQIESKPLEDALFFARDVDLQKPRVLVIDHYIPKVDRDTGSKCMHHFLLELSKDCVVKFWPDNHFHDREYSRFLTNAGIEVFAGNRYVNKFASFWAQNGKYFDYVVLSRPHISIKYLDVLRQYSSTTIYYYGHDLHFERMARENELCKKLGVPEKNTSKSIAQTRAWEFECWQKTDASFYLTERETQLLATFGFNATAVIPIFSRQAIPPLSEPREFMIDMLFVGGFAHAPNVDGLSWFIESILPLIRKRHPQVRFTVCGSAMSKELKQMMTGRAVAFEENVSNQRLDELYSVSRLVVAPLRYGSGLKGKVVEALLLGRPVVSTSIGYEGLAVPKKMIKDGETEFAEEVSQLLIDKRYYDRSLAAQKSFLDTYYQKVSFADMKSKYFKRRI